MTYHSTLHEWTNMAIVRTTVNITIHVKKQPRGVSDVYTEMVEIRSYVPTFFSALFFL